MFIALSPLPALLAFAQKFCQLDLTCNAAYASNVSLTSGKAKQHVKQTACQPLPRLVAEQVA